MIGLKSEKKNSAIFKEIKKYYEHHKNKLISVYKYDKDFYICHIQNEGGRDLYTGVCDLGYIVEDFWHYTLKGLIDYLKIVGD